LLPKKENDIQIQQCRPIFLMWVLRHSQKWEQIVQLVSHIKLFSQLK
jgi:hypothetical protein